MSVGKTFKELIDDTLAGLRQPAGNYNRYSLVSIKSALNIANMEAATRLRCLHSFAIILLRDGYNQYPFPSDLLVPKKAFYYQSAKSYVDLTRKGWVTRNYLDRYLQGWRSMSGPPYWAFIGDSSGNLRKLGVTPTPNADGTNYLTTPDTGVVISVDGLTTTGNIIGRNTAAHATTCTDADGRTMSTLGVTVGMIALNVSDGSQGQITAVTGTTFSVTLTGGTANTWAVGDSFTVLAGEYGVVVNIDGAESYIFTSDYGELIAISALTGNVYLEYYRKPLPLTIDTQFPEIPEELHPYLPEYAIWWLKRRVSPGANDVNDAMIGKQAFDEKIPPNRFVPLDEEAETSIISFNW